MSRYKQICLTGLDRVGKASQARLLSLALTPSKLYSFPDYGLWTGQIIRAILSEEEFEIRRWQGGTKEIVTSHEQEKEPYVFQALQFANMRQLAPQMRAARERQHLVLDRGPECALAFGLVDGCDLPFLLELQRHQPPSDLVFCLMGQPIPRPNEIPDQNERNTAFQGRVAEAYQGLCRLFPQRFVPVLVDAYRDPEPGRSMAQLHRHLVNRVNDLLAPRDQIRPLSENEVRAAFGLPVPVPAQRVLPGLEWTA